MARDAAQKYDAGAAAFFLENLCQDVDVILRFGFALALDETKAQKLTKLTYGSIVPQIPELLNIDSTQIRMRLLRRAWELFHEEPDEGVSHLPLAEMMRDLELGTRAVLFLVDVFGLTCTEAREITKMDDAELRQHLAKARKKLLRFRFD